MTGIWNVTSLVGKVPELVHEVESFCLDIARLTLMHGLSSGSSPLEQEGLFPAPLGRGTGPDCCPTYPLKGSSEYPAFLESQGGVLKGAPAGNFVILLEDFNTHVGNDTLTAVIKTQQTVLAAVGEDAEFSCQLLETKDVLQVTWQKISQDVETNVATYNKYFGQRVNDGFTDKFKFKYTGLQNCSIVIRNVMQQDEGCYHCLFNTYPEGSLTGRPCLQVYELHDPVVDVRQSNSTEEWVVSCSATGRPAPTVTLSVSQQHLNLSQYNTVSVSNTNTTFTVTTTAVLSGSRTQSTQVGCAARVLSAPHREVMVTIPEVQEEYDDDDDYDDG
ncbi:nectin-1-like [Pelmatolapia mariae]|uniref:nectin-1-like n=1 Tax=Pelmatolapia mariae TaxID=158779 RepID=UPI002FE5AB5B